MKKMIMLIFTYLALFPASVYAKEELSQSVDFTLKVNVLKPVCKLTTDTQTIDFGEVDVDDLTKIKGSATFKFIDCDNVERLKIRFEGDELDKENNVIRNKVGSNYATGVYFKLYDDKNYEIKLDADNVIKINKEANYDLKLTAKVLRDELGAGNRFSPGLLNSSVALEITYE
ncbi:TPA: type 1 fimbrial protein [Escherichia coli]|uniref:fimbrial protein n=1 Tax=Escherichia coli TaxID=562 RepID=UPI00107A9FE3|nr:fimbrial protein [Escherichia coli]EAA6331141.1 type 1 fimbrial protein [Salmonella enterica subsp. enterica serovar Napoli]ECE9990863.1 type 1 fimbrial protein [Salmonella enterica subsp. enterica serovar Typhimurium]EJZ0751633.1 type 1 fimbrial protein [Escherichia coli]MCF2433738.1 fimbrial protein [Escherichia coli]MCH4661492.1 fimbrial protein [Escherichia coli]